MYHSYSVLKQSGAKTYRVVEFLVIQTMNILPRIST